ncbi:MAG: hypothetical protein V1743_03830 [Nanoarchaeota archaeon]
MALGYLTLDIRYHLNSDRFEVGGDVRRDGQRGLVETFLRTQIGAGEDTRVAKEQDTYHIRLQWHPECDMIEVKSDTGNKSLQDGILLHFLNNFDK